MQVGIWYWHTPFQVSKDELGWLKKIGVSTLYVRAATFTTDGVRVKPKMPQRWQSNAEGMPVVLVYNFDAGLRSHFEALPNKGMADEVVGVQMDVDCPTRLLPKYADLLRLTRVGLVANGALAHGESFSATALQTWLTSNDYGKLAEACDFVVPQFYEGRVGRKVGDVQPIADTQNIAPGMRRADAVGKPFFVGVATYGHSLIYDERGKLVGMYHGMPPEEALRHPSLRFDRTTPLTEKGQGIGENVLVLHAVHPDQNGRGMGYRIAYVLPTSKMLARELESVHANPSSNCRGVIIYRYPELGDEFSLPLPTVAQVFAGKPTNLEIKPELTRRAAPWSLIGDRPAAKKTPFDYSVSLRSIGTSSSLASPDAVTVLVYFNGEGLDEAAVGDFDEVKMGRVDPRKQFIPCAAAHANAVLYRRNVLLPGVRIRSGSISVSADGPRPAHVYWTVRNDDGVTQTTGDMLSSFSDDFHLEAHP
jgi:hypothetical protein